MKDIDTHIFVFMLIGLIEVQHTQKKNKEANNEYEITKNINKLYIILLIDLLVYIASKKLKLSNSTKYMIELIFLIATII